MNSIPEAIGSLLERYWGPDGRAAILEMWSRGHQDPPHSAEEAEDFFLGVID